MVVLKCKMCGGTLEFIENKSTAVCEYCGTNQTVPTSDDEKKTNLFNRANRLRMASEFDLAASVYESIIAEFSDESEAYWGAVLCKYGIEYVDDPRTAEKVPTCHRTSFESIFNDNNYKMAIKYSDMTSPCDISERSRDYRFATKRYIGDCARGRTVRCIYLL